MNEQFCTGKLVDNFSNFFVHILGKATTSYFHSEISWPLCHVRMENKLQFITLPICRNQIYQITGQNCRQLIIIESNLNQTISSKLVSMFICCSCILTCDFNHWAITNCRFQTGNVWPQCWFLSYLWWNSPGWQGCHYVNSFICLQK